MTDDDTIRGRAEIAFRLGRSERTVSRWVRRSLLKASKDGPFDNNLLRVCSADLQRLKHGEGEDD
jgi:hypothetical protein